VKKSWKKSYNKEYRDRDYPRSMGGKALIDPKRAGELDSPSKDRKKREFTRDRAERVPSKEVKTIKARKLKNMMQQAAPAAASPRRRGGERVKSSKKQPKKASTQKKMSMEDFELGIRDRLILERKARESASWMKKLELQKGALKQEYGLDTSEPIPANVWKKIEKDKQALMLKSAKGTLSDADRRKLRRIVLGLTFKRLSGDRETTESRAPEIDQHTLRLLNVLRDVI
jgi:hypothetical protein